MAADRRIGAQREGIELVHRLGIELFAHAVQALELDRDAGGIGHAADGGQRVGIVRGELRIDERRGIDQRLGADEVAEVRRRLGGVHGVVVAAHHLGALDLGVPIGALDQADHQPAAALFGQDAQGGDDLGATLLIGLNGEAQALPVAEFRLVRQLVEQLQRQGQAIGFLGVQREVDIGPGGLDRQRLDAGIEHGEDVVGADRFVTRIERRQLDRNAMIAFGATAGDLGQRGDGVGIGLGVAHGVVFGACPFAQHVERAQIAFLLGALQRVLDGPAQDELLAHDADGLGDGSADDRLADALGQAGEIAFQVALGAVLDIDDPAGQHQAPGRGVDEPIVGLAEMRGPVGRRDLFGDQLVAGGFVRRAQQGLRQAHQGQTLARAQAELLEEAFDDALALGRLARGADQAFGLGADDGAQLVVQWSVAQQPGADIGVG